MTAITFIVGMPGSGKTHLATTIADNNCILVDDITGLEQLPEQLFTSLIVIDVNFCDKDILAKAISTLSKKYNTNSIKIIYFENDGAKCRQNVKYRNDGRLVEGTIRRFEKTYCPPSDALTIWQNTID